MRKLRLIKPWQLTTVRQPLSFERADIRCVAESSAYQPCMGPRGSEDREIEAPAEAVRCMGPRGTDFDRMPVSLLRR